MILGMTGNRKGISAQAQERLEQFLSTHDITEAHHGDCLGADTEFHVAVASHEISIVIHPPTNPSMRAWNKGPQTTIGPAKDYLVRNRAIVRASDVLIAFPGTMHEVLRSGTWSTIRNARKLKKIVYIIYPDGTVER